MTINIRALFKTMLKNTGPFYEMAKQVYQSYKLREDGRRVVQLHPDVEVITLDKATFQSMRDKGYTSQFGQDFYLLETIFAGSAPGTFAEIGANHPIKNNNSYAFERAGWTGWAFDPLTRFTQDWAKHRSTPFTCCALSDVEGKRSFVEFKDRVGWEHQLSGFADAVRDEDLKIHAHTTYEVECKPLTKLLPDVTRLDLVMIDVEGAEMFVIEGLGLDKLRIDWLMVENVSVLGGDEQIRTKLKDYGYVLRARIASTDDLYEFVE